MTGAAPGSPRVVVTRPAGREEPLRSLLEARGAEVMVLPLFGIAPPSAPERLEGSLGELSGGRYDWVVVASVPAAEALLKGLGIVDRSGERPYRVAAVGPATGRALTEGGIEVDLIPDGYSAAGVAAGLPQGGIDVLLVRVEDGPRSAVEVFEERGHRVTEAPAYRNVPQRPEGPPARAVEAGAFDVMTFASPSAAQALRSFVSPEEVGLEPGGTSPRRVACIGPSTAEGAAAAGFRVDAVAEEHTAEGLVEAVVSLLPA